MITGAGAGAGAGAAAAGAGAGAAVAALLAPQLLDLACAVAVDAGALLVAGASRAAVIDTKSSPTDVVTEMDRAAEELIRRRILAQRPADAILGEEGGEVAGPAAAGVAAGDAAAGGPAAGGRSAGRVSAVRWVVDPLDGTVNYLYGLPDWAVSIAAEIDGAVVAGAVFLPRRAALFSAQLGGGAWLRTGPQPAASSPAGLPRTGSALAGPPLAGPPWAGAGLAGLGLARRLRCNTAVPLARALVATGFGYEARRRVVQAEVLSGVLPRVRDIRRGGSCAVDLCSLAAGQVDAYFERGVHEWDIAAGALIAREAGAVVAGLSGRQAGTSMTLAAAPELFAELQDLLASLNPERDAGYGRSGDADGSGTR